MRLSRLRTRFGDECWLCGLPMDFQRVSGGTSLQASVDHIVPVPHAGKKRNNAGGMKDNFKLAHIACNSLRHDKPVTPELKRGLRKMITKILESRLCTCGEVRHDGPCVVVLKSKKPESGEETGRLLGLEAVRSK